MQNEDRTNAIRMIKRTKIFMLIQPNISGLFINTICILLNSLAYIFSLQQKTSFILSTTFKIRSKPSISSPLRSISFRIILLIFTVSDEVGHGALIGYCNSKIIL